MYSVYTRLKPLSGRSWPVLTYLTYTAAVLIPCTLKGVLDYSLGIWLSKDGINSF